MTASVRTGHFPLDRTNSQIRALLSEERQGPGAHEIAALRVRSEWVSVLDEINEADADGIDVRSSSIAKSLIVSEATEQG